MQNIQVKQQKYEILMMLNLSQGNLLLIIHIGHMINLKKMILVIWIQKIINILIRL